MSANPKQRGVWQFWGGQHPYFWVILEVFRLRRIQTRKARLKPKQRKQNNSWERYCVENEGHRNRYTLCSQILSKSQS